ncbi:Averufin oxidase A [Aspergillus lucknowensis]|uniref:Averufin oxidase A n=1 Tax=Aspergillus lucknowensis TaxID=176173 RepID=A0ABR4LSK5_9EURO
MQTYALLGATGATGSSILRHLLHNHPESQELTINILVRSKSKLLIAFPTLETSLPRKIQVNIVQGDSTSPEALDTCLQNASVVFMCVAQNGSPMGTTLVQDTASALIAALRRRRHRHSHPEDGPVTVIQLRSASLNPALAAQVPRAVHALVSFCLHAGYADLQAACALYEDARGEGVLEYVLVDPPTLHDAHGTQATGYRLITTETEKQAICLSYADLGAALCEVAERRGEFAGRAVGVTATGGVRKNWGVLAGYLVSGGWDHLCHLYGRENAIVFASCVALVLVALAYV